MKHSLVAPLWVAADEVPTWHAAEIVPGLFMGGTPDHDVVHHPAIQRYDTGSGGPYEAVVTLYAWAQPVSWGGRGTALRLRVLILAGYDAADAIRLIRERRSPWALRNNAFVDWLLTDGSALMAPYRAGSGNQRVGLVV